MSACPLLAQSGHRLVRCTCPLSGVEQTFPTSQDQLPRRIAGIGALCGAPKKGAPMALDTNTFLIVLAAGIIVMAFVVWAMFKKVS